MKLNETNKNGKSYFIFKNNNFLFNNQPRHYTKCFSIGSCKIQPLCISNSSYFKIYIFIDN